MKEAQRVLTNRCFNGNNCPQNPKKQPKEEKTKELLSEATRRKGANKEIDFLLKQFRGKSILQLLPVISRRCSKAALAVALERVERRRDDLPMDDLVFFEEFKISLK